MGDEEVARCGGWDGYWLMSDVSRVSKACTLFTLSDGHISMLSFFPRSHPSDSAPSRRVSALIESKVAAVLSSDLVQKELSGRLQKEREAIGEQVWMCGCGR